MFILPIKLVVGIKYNHQYHISTYHLNVRRRFKHYTPTFHILEHFDILCDCVIIRLQNVKVLGMVAICQAAVSDTLILGFAVKYCFKERKLIFEITF